MRDVESGWTTLTAVAIGVHMVFVVGRPEAGSSEEKKRKKRRIGHMGRIKQIKWFSEARGPKKVRRDGIQWGRGESNSHASRHMILSHACLPVPALPQGQRNVIFYHFG